MNVLFSKYSCIRIIMDWIQLAQDRFQLLNTIMNPRFKMASQYKRPRLETSPR
jgi:hypothetical protein